MNSQVLNGTAITDTSLVDLCAFMNTASISNIPILLSAQSAGALVKAMTTSAPVQPVAVPDGWQATDDEIAAWATRHDLRINNATDRRAIFEDAESLRPGIAAPAAQGDAKDAELARIKRLAACGTVDSFLLLPEQDKRYWFAMAWQESDLRKLAEERIAFLHSTNKDADGYEFGIAKVKFDATGKIESFLWGLGDNSDIDAAIAAKAAS